MNENEILCFGCAHAFHQDEVLGFPGFYGNDIKYRIKCGWCGWEGFLVIDVKRLEPNISDLLLKDLTRKEK